MALPARRLPIQRSVLDAAGFVSLQERMSRDLFALDVQQRRDDDADSLSSLLDDETDDYGAGITGTTGYEGMLGATAAPAPAETPSYASPDDADLSASPQRTTGLMAPTVEMPTASAPEPRRQVYDPVQTAEIQGPPDYDPTEDAGTVFSGPSAVPSAPTASVAAPADPSSWEGKAHAAAVKAGHPNPAQFVAQMRWESGNFDPNVIAGQRNSPAGAEGIAQIMRRYHPGVDPLNPDAALDYAARLMKSHYDQYGDSDTALAAYNGGPGAVAAMRAGKTYGETKQYLREINSRVSERAAIADPASAPTQRASEGRNLAGETRLQGITPPQFGLGDADAEAICGPVLAMAFAQSTGRNPTIAEAKAMATQYGGWTKAAGMGGPDAMANTLRQMGIPATYRPGALDIDTIRRETSNGNPVGINTRGHYFVVEGVDEQGRLDLGNSAKALKASGGRQWFHPSEIPALGMGAPTGAIYKDSPSSPTPSVAVRETGMPPVALRVTDPAARRDADAAALAAEPAPTAPDPTAERLAERSADPRTATTDAATVQAGAGRTGPVEVAPDTEWGAYPVWAAPEDEPDLTIDLPGWASTADPEQGRRIGQGRGRDAGIRLWMNAYRIGGNDPVFADVVAGIANGEAGFAGVKDARGAIGLFQMDPAGGWQQLDRYLADHGIQMTRDEAAKDVDIMSDFYVTKLHKAYTRAKAAGHTEPEDLVIQTSVYQFDPQNEPGAAHNSGIEQQPRLQKNYLDGYREFKQGVLRLLDPRLFQAPEAAADPRMALAGGGAPQGLGGPADALLPDGGTAPPVTSSYNDPEAGGTITAPLPTVQPYDPDQGPREAIPGSVGAQPIISPMAPAENPGVSVTAATPAPPQVVMEDARVTPPTGDPYNPRQQSAEVEVRPRPAPQVAAEPPVVQQSMPSMPGLQPVLDAAGNVIAWVQAQARPVAAPPSIAAPEPEMAPPGSPYAPDAMGAAPANRFETPAPTVTQQAGSSVGAYLAPVFEPERRAAEAIQSARQPGGLLEPLGGGPRITARMEQIRAEAAAELGRSSSDFRVTDDPDWRARHPELADEMDQLEHQLALVVAGQVGDSARVARNSAEAAARGVQAAGPGSPLAAQMPGVGQGATRGGTAAPGAGLAPGGFAARDLPDQVVAAHAEHGGSTFNPTRGNLVGQPEYAVSLYPERGIVLDRPPTTEDIAAFVKKNKTILADPRISVGTWFDARTGEHFVDLTATVADRDLAIALGRSYNQRGIYNLLDLEEIRTGGSGTVPRRLPPVETRLPLVGQADAAAQQGLRAQAREIAEGRGTDWWQREFGNDPKVMAQASRLEAGLERALQQTTDARGFSSLDETGLKPFATPTTKFPTDVIPRPTPIPELRQVIEAGLERGYGNWYREFAEDTARSVGDKRALEGLANFASYSAILGPRAAKKLMLSTMLAADSHKGFVGMDVPQIVDAVIGTYKRVVGTEKGLYYLPVSFQNVESIYRTGGQQIGQPKLSNFFNDFINGRLPWQSDATPTNDVQMQRLEGYQSWGDVQTKLGSDDNTYRYGAAVTRRVAQELGVPAEDAQAAGWVVQQLSSLPTANVDFAEARRLNLADPAKADHWKAVEPEWKALAAGVRAGRVTPGQALDEIQRLDLFDFHNPGSIQAINADPAIVKLQTEYDRLGLKDAPMPGGPRERPGTEVGAPALRGGLAHTAASVRPWMSADLRTRAENPLNQRMLEQAPVVAAAGASPLPGAAIRELRVPNRIVDLGNDARGVALPTMNAERATNVATRLAETLGQPVMVRRATSGDELPTHVQVTIDAANAPGLKRSIAQVRSAAEGLGAEVHWSGQQAHILFDMADATLAEQRVIDLYHAVQSQGINADALRLGGSRVERIEPGGAAAGLAPTAGAEPASAGSWRSGADDQLAQRLAAALGSGQSGSVPGRRPGGPVRPGREAPPAELGTGAQPSRPRTNAERVAAADARMAEQGSTSTLGTVGVAPSPRAPEPEVAPPFFSQLRRTIDEKMPNRSSAQQIQGILRGSAVKPDEIAWTGFDDWLASQRGPVTKQQALDFLDQHEVRVEEVVKGVTRPRADGSGIEFDPSSSPTRYPGYTLPGGENYRELLLTLPRREAQMTRSELAVRPSQTTPGAFDIVETQSGRVVRPDFPNQAEAAEELAFRQRQPTPARDVANYQSAHWDEPNVLAHVRFNDRTAPDGTRTLLIEEVQSDWHQAGRKSGYQGTSLLGPDGLPEGWTIRDRGADAPGARYEAVNENGIPQWSDTSPDAVIAAIRRTHHDPRPPDAPFKKTWPELAIKRMVRYAAENGYDRIAWPPGAVHNERYSLTQHIDELFYTTKDGATGTLVAQKGGQEVAVHENVPADKLGDYVGREVADRMLSMDPDITAQGDQYYLTGRNLAEVGGEGMKGFYDQILPSVAQKIGKKFGARVGQTDVTTAPHGYSVQPARFGLWNVYDQDMNIVRSLPSEAEAQAFAAQHARTQTVHSMDITPQMRESVMQQGQPLFVTPGPVASRGAGTLAQVNADVGSAIGSSTFGAAAGAALPAESDEERAQNALRGAGLGLVGGPVASRIMRRGGGALATPGVSPGGQGPLGALGQQFPDVAAWYRREQAKNTARMTAEGITPASKTDIVRGTAGTIGYGSMLGPATASFNAAAGLMQPAWAALKEPTRAVYRALGTRNPEALKEPLVAMDSVMHGLNDVSTALWDVIRARGKYAPSPDSPMLSQRLADPIGRGLMQALETPGRFWAGAPDAVFGTLAQRAVEGRRAAQLATDAGHRGQQWEDWVALYRKEVERVRASGAPPHQIGTGTADVMQAGEQAAERGAYRQPLGTIGTQVRKLARLGDFPVAGNFVAPFFNSPWNIHLQALERSPAGLVMNTQPSKFDKYYDAVVGSAAILGLVEMTRQGHITINGSGPTNPNERQAWIDAGNRPYSMVVGGVAVPNRLFSGAEPLLNAAGETMDYFRYPKKDADARALSEEALTRVGRLIKQHPYAAGYATIADLAQFGPAAALADVGTRMTPGAATLRAIGTAGDPSERTVDRGAGVSIPDEAYQRWQQATGQRADLPVAQNILGEPKENPQPGAWAFFGRLGYRRDDPVIQVFQDARVFPGDPPRDIRGIQLTPRERREWDAYRGEALRELIPDVADAVKDETPDVREKALKNAFETAARIARGRLIESMGDDFDTRLEATFEKAGAGR